jgi:acyl-CoA thioesterase I
MPPDKKNKKGQLLMKKLLLVLSFVLASFGSASAQIVALGASNVAGRGVSSSEAFPAQLERMLAAKGYQVHVTNAGISGDTNEGMLTRLDSAVPDGTKIVILDIGGGTFNARRKNLGDQTAELKTIAARLRARGIKIIPASGGGITQKQVDGVHLTAEGHAILAARLLPAVIRAIH